MDDIDRVLPMNTLPSNNLTNHRTPNPTETKSNAPPIAARSQQLRSSLTGRCLVLNPDAFIPVHVDLNGVPNEDISKEVPCTLYDPYFAAKNKRRFNLALESMGKLRSGLEVKVISDDLEPQNDLENMYVELFRGTEDCQLLKVTFVCANSGTNRGAWTVTCEGMSMEVSRKVRQFYDELAQVKVAERKIMNLLVKY